MLSRSSTGWWCRTELVLEGAYNILGIVLKDSEVTIELKIATGLNPVVVSRHLLKYCKRQCLVSSMQKKLSNDESDLNTWDSEEKYRLLVVEDRSKLIVRRCVGVGAYCTRMEVTEKHWSASNCQVLYTYDILMVFSWSLKMKTVPIHR